MVIPGDDSGKRANSVAERGIRAYDFDFIVFLYAFPCKNGVLKRLLAERGMQPQGEVKFSGN